MVQNDNRRTDLAEVVMQLKLGNRLLAAQLASRMTQQELIVLLSSTSATKQHIAETLGTTPATVANALLRIRKRGPPGPVRRRA
jgi:DNA-binding CsgD family transcriptional regulator